MVHAAMVASIAGPMVARTPAAVEQPRARPLRHREPRSGAAIQENVGRPTFPGSLRPARDDGAPLTPGLAVTKWREGSAQPFEKARFAERKELGFCFPWLGFSFPKAWIFLPWAWIFLQTAWIFLPPLRAEG